MSASAAEVTGKLMLNNGAIIGSNMILPFIISTGRHVRDKHDVEIQIYIHLFLRRTLM